MLLLLNFRILLKVLTPLLLVVVGFDATIGGFDAFSTIVGGISFFFFG